MLLNAIGVLKNLSRIFDAVVPTYRGHSMSYASEHKRKTGAKY
jgi:TPP-dependent pyruvate/acetoin dehydrogenase alpha subunit